jgi:hypothetical protein
MGICIIDFIDIKNKKEYAESIPPKGERNTENLVM